MHSAHALVLAAASAAALLVSGAGVPARAADPAKEIATAATHAGFAAKATDLKTVDMHLHHVVNCLVGPQGKGFDAKQVNPCKSYGGGALPDFAGAPAEKRKLQQALAAAEAGLGQSDLAAARKDATTAQAALAHP